MRILVRLFALFFAVCVVSVNVHAKETKEQKLQKEVEGLKSELEKQQILNKSLNDSVKVKDSNIKDLSDKYESLEKENTKLLAESQKDEEVDLLKWTAVGLDVLLLIAAILFFIMWNKSRSGNKGSDEKTPTALTEDSESDKGTNKKSKKRDESEFAPKGSKGMSAEGTELLKELESFKEMANKLKSRIESGK